MTDLQTLKAQSQALAIKIAEAKKYDRLVNEGGEGYDSSEKLSIEKCGIDAQIAEIEFAAEWTPEVTNARRAAWNNAVTSANPKQLTTKFYGDLQRKLGYGPNALKQAIKLNNL